MNFVMREGSSSPLLYGPRSGRSIPMRRVPNAT